MKKKKVLKIILLVVLVAIMIFLICTIRKMIIIKELNERVTKYANSTNYYEKIVNNIGTTTETYCKGDKAVLFLNTITENGTRKLTSYFLGETQNTYLETDKDKIVILNSNGILGKTTIGRFCDDDNLKFLFLMATQVKIKNDEYNGKECYVISFGKTNEYYFEKDTGLKVKAKDGIETDSNGNKKTIIVEYFYEFDNVDDSIFIEPDISEYKIQENN